MIRVLTLALDVVVVVACCSEALRATRPRRRSRRRHRTARRASAGVKGVLTWPRRRQAARYAGEIALRIDAARSWEARPVPDPRMLALLFPGAIGTPTPAASVSTWAPGRIAAMPTDRCNACPVWGCSAKGADPECEAHPFRPGCGCARCSSVENYVEIRAAASAAPVGYVPTAPLVHPRDAALILRDWQAAADARRERTARTRYRIAKIEARCPQPGDDEIAKPPRDEFDAHRPPSRYRARADRCAECGRNAALGHDYCIACDRAFDVAPDPPDPLYPPHRR